VTILRDVAVRIECVCRDAQDHDHQTGPEIETRPCERGHNRSVSRKSPDGQGRHDSSGKWPFKGSHYTSGSRASL